jgi:gamma-glutamyltranspeptidase / glutathione hydrolase
MRHRGIRAQVAVVSISVALLFGVTASAAVAPSGPPTSTGTGGAAASVERLATQTAIETLQSGGNAVDAAVAAAGVLGVTEPFSCGIGGGGFMVIRAADGKVTTIDGRETAPAAMMPTSFWENGAPLPFNDARWSGMSVGVPGTLATWAEALEKYGTVTLAQALQPGIQVARNGFVIDQTFFDQTRAAVPWFDDIPATAALFLDPDGTPHDVGTVFRNPDLARAYERIAHLGAKGLYRGAIADAIVETARHPVVAPTADHVWRSGLMAMRDLHDYAAPERAPTHVTYRGLDVYSMGPPSSGGSTVGEALNILEGYDLASMTREQAFHYFLEASRYSFADRNAYLADPDYFAVPLSGLLSKSYAAARRSLITPTAANPAVVAPGNPYPFVTGQAAATATQSETTTHLTTSDKWGNVVSYTFTIESTGGSGLVVPGWGFLLNNELTDFNYDSTTHPNRVEGGKRPRSSMAPTIVLQNQKPFLALGSPGGSTIITTVLQILFDRLDQGMTLPQAIADPRASQRNSTTTGAEPAFLSSPLRTQLAARGHGFSDGGEIGAATGIEFLPAGNVLAAAEPVRRGGGSALVENPVP